MNYIYYVNGEERKPTPEEARRMNDTALRAAGYVPVAEAEKILRERAQKRAKSS